LPSCATHGDLSKPLEASLLRPSTESESPQACPPGGAAGGAL